MIESKANMSWKFLQAVAAELDRDAPLMQALAFTRIAMAGDVGLNQASLIDELKASSAAVSRTTQALSRIHYLKDREGYGLIEIEFGESDRRSRILRLSLKGKTALARIVATLG